MSTTGEVVPSANQTVSEAPYEHFTWQTPQNIYANDGNNAYIDDNAFDSGVESYILKAQGFDFSAIPDTATINGVTVKVEAHYTTGAAGIALAQLLNTSGAKGGTNLCSTPAAITVTNPTVITIGAADNLWGNALTPAWVKDPDFGVALGVIPTGNNSNVYIDYITMEVTYTAAVTSVNADKSDSATLSESVSMRVNPYHESAADVAGLSEGLGITQAMNIKMEDA